MLGLLDRCFVALPSPSPLPSISLPSCSISWKIFFNFTFLPFVEFFHFYDHFQSPSFLFVFGLEAAVL